tara:strand:+ start:5545 stop:5826 length:282 start_codon:yes stop_codon:yes gene_type:complete
MSRKYADQADDANPAASIVYSNTLGIDATSAISFTGCEICVVVIQLLACWEPLLTKMREATRSILVYLDRNVGARIPQPYFVPLYVPPLDVFM